MGKSKLPEKCPCGSGMFFQQCCDRYISGKESAPSATTLMRSRYTAYTLDDQSYLLKTWYPASRPELDRFKQESCKWIGLTILEEHVAERSATVEFVAKYKINGRAEQMHEISNFVLEGGAWFYVDGIFVS